MNWTPLNRVDPQTEEHHIRKEYLATLKSASSAKHVHEGGKDEKHVHEGGKDEKHVHEEEEEEEEDEATSKKINMANEKPAVLVVCPDETLPKIRKYVV